MQTAYIDDQLPRYSCMSVCVCRAMVKKIGPLASCDERI